MACQKKFTNTKHTKIILNWAYNKLDRKAIIEPYALNQVVDFIDNDDYNSLLEQHRNLFEQKILIENSKDKASNLDKIAEKNEKTQQKVYKEKNKTEDKIDVSSNNVKNIAKIDVSVTDEGGEKV